MTDELNKRMETNAPTTIEHNLAERREAALKSLVEETFEVLERRFRKAQALDAKLTESLGGSDLHLATVWGGYDVGYQRGMMSAYDIIQGVLEKRYKEIYRHSLDEPQKRF